ncbi:hypothetical protein [Mycolicibacterium sp. CBMA 226]|uniref:hypothetical protein n=1 Tax=Mycolicibacterium sp. CBMA 226 TaxID=2606611 RepID=UPI0012DC312C|nr:hypothetical protein [Mycolicibacterium sp. CBMA 226]MUL77858.1 hypothetical protein [Mycolicibacterium sp. CBMA 226]
MGIRVLAVAICCATLLGCSTEKAVSASSTASTSPQVVYTTPGPPEIEEDCGVVHQYRTDTSHAIRGSKNIDCAEAHRVGELWWATPNGSAGYYVEFENWKCLAESGKFNTRCTRSDSAVVLLQDRETE